MDYKKGIEKIESPYTACGDDIGAVWNRTIKAIPPFHAAEWNALEVDERSVIIRVFNEALTRGAHMAITEEGLLHTAAKLKEPKAEPEWHRELIFEHVKEVRRNRHEQYNKGEQSSMARNFKAIGSVWRALLASYFQIDIPPIPGWLAASMMSALKLLRIAWNSDLEDSYVDAINYAALAEEVHHLEQLERSEQVKHD